MSAHVGPVAGTRDGGEGYQAMTPVARPVPLRHQVQEALRSLIVSGVLAPAQHLVEAEVADRLGVSRGPVREALQALQAEGWVELRPGRGAFVHAPTVEEVGEVFGVRAALESEAAALASCAVTADDVAELREVSARGRAAVLRGEYDLVVATNSELHRRIAEHAGNAMLCRLIASLDDRIRWYLRPVVRNRGESSWDEHDGLIDALAAHDADAARELMRQHTERTRQANVANRD